MFDELRRLNDFLSMEPYFISIAFAGSFLLTVITIRLCQSQVLYEWFLGRIEAMKRRQASRIRREMSTDLASMLRGRKVEDLAAVEQKFYFHMMESYYQRILSLYPLRRRYERRRKAK